MFVQLCKPNLVAPGQLWAGYNESLQSFHAEHLQCCEATMAICKTLDVLWHAMHGVLQQNFSERGFPYPIACGVVCLKLAVRGALVQRYPYSVGGEWGSFKERLGFAQRSSLLNANPR